MCLQTCHIIAYVVLQTVFFPFRVRNILLKHPSKTVIIDILLFEFSVNFIGEEMMCYFNLHFFNN